MSDDEDNYQEADNDEDDKDGRQRGRWLDNE